MIRRVVSSRKFRAFFSSKLRRKEFEEDFLFPNESEGNTYMVNWSLVEDGLTVTGDVFRNPRKALLATRLGVAKDFKDIQIKKPLLFGNYKILESGEQITHQDFSELKNAQALHFSSGRDLFVEDGSLGSYQDIRVGVRVVSDNPAMSLICRNLFISTPPCKVDHRSRYNGWNLDERWVVPATKWEGGKLEVVPSSKPLKGQRPIVVFAGSLGDTIAVQFVEVNGKVGGANILLGEAAPIEGMIEAIGMAADALMNEDTSVVGFSLDSDVVVSKDKVVSFIGSTGKHDIINVAAKKKLLFGPYKNYYTTDGVSASWNGYLLSGTNFVTDKTSHYAVVSSTDGAAVVNDPDNLANPVTEFVFVGDANTGKLSHENAVMRILNVSHPSKEEAIKSVLQGAKLSLLSAAQSIELIHSL